MSRFSSFFGGKERSQDKKAVAAPQFVAAFLNTALANLGGG
jgi:hypothetical protein